MLCRPAGSALFHHRRSPKDISLGGMRVFSDEEFVVGRRVDLEILLPHGEAVRCWAEVVWTVALGDRAPARWDVGLKFTDMEPADLQRLASVLAR